MVTPRANVPRATRSWGKYVTTKLLWQKVKAGGVLKGARLWGGQALPMVVSDGDLTQGPVTRCREAMPTN